MYARMLTDNIWYIQSAVVYCIVHDRCMQEHLFHISKFGVSIFGLF